MSQTDLNDLLTRVSLADRQAFKRLYQCSSGKLYAIALRVMTEEKLAEDVLQESFIKIWNNANRFNPHKAQAITWMGAIVRNHAIDSLRKNKKNLENQAFDEDTHFVSVDDYSMNPTEEGVINHENQQVVYDCLKQLNEKYRSIILLAYLNGYTHKEIAEVKGLSISNVKNRIHRGIAMVKQCLQAAFHRH